MGVPRPAPDLILYSGTFDPPHNGHLAVVRAVRAKFPQAHILISVTPRPARAADLEKDVTTPLDIRETLCKIAFASVLDADVELTTFEADLPAPQYSALTLQALSKRFPKAHLGMVIGGDQLRNFANWYRPDIVQELATVIVAARGDAPMAPGMIGLENIQHPASSAAIRNLLHTGEPIPADWLHPEVRALVSTHCSLRSRT